MSQYFVSEPGIPNSRQEPRTTEIVDRKKPDPASRYSGPYKIGDEISLDELDKLSFLSVDGAGSAW